MGNQIGDTAIGSGAAPAQDASGALINSLTPADYRAARNGNQPSDAQKAGGAAANAGDAADKQKDTPQIARLKEILCKYLPLVYPPGGDGGTANDGSQNPDQQNLQKLLESIKNENGVGPDTKKAFEMLVDQLKVMVPHALAQLDNGHLEIPPNCPIQLPRDQNGFVLDPAIFSNLAASHDPQLELSLDANTIDSRSIGKLENVINWLGQATDSIQAENNRQVDSGLRGLIGDLIGNNDPQLTDRWLSQDGMQPDEWRRNANQVVTESINFRNYIEAGIQLKKADKYNGIDFELPPGVSVEEKDGHTVLKGFTDLLPDSMDMSNPRNAEKVERMEAWLKKYSPEINKILDQTKNADTFSWGDDVVPPGAKAIFDSDSMKFKGLAGKDYKVDPANKECTLDPETNLMEYRYSVNETKDAKGQDQISITQHERPQHARWWSYQNWIGVTNVGGDNGDNVRTHSFAPDDFVRVRDGDQVVLMKASELSHFKMAKATEHWTGKLVTTAFDALMLVDGLGAGCAFLRAGDISAKAASRLAMKEAADQLVNVSSRDVALQGVRAGGKLLAAAAGITNNAWGQTHEIGEAINTGRALYFLSDIGAGFVPKSFKDVVRPTVLSDMAQAGQKFDKLMDQAEWLNSTRKGVHLGFKIAEFAMIPGLAGDIGRIVFPKDGGRVDLADELAGNDRTLNLPKDGTCDTSKPEVLNRMRTVLDGYDKTLESGRDPATSAEVQRIISQTKELLDPKHTDAERAAFKDSLVGKFRYDEDTVKKLEVNLGKSLTDQDLQDLLDQDKRALLRRQVQDATADRVNYISLPPPEMQRISDLQKELAICDEADKKFNKDVQTAAAVSMLYLSMDKNGQISDKVASQSMAVPEQKFEANYDTSLHIISDRHAVSPDYAERAPGADVQTIKAHNVDSSVSAQELASFLRRDLMTAPDQLGNRGIVSGDMLTKMGALSGVQYAAVLRDVLENPNASREDKLKSLCDPNGQQFDAALGVLSRAEQLASTPDQLAAVHHMSSGVSAADMKGTLEHVMTSDKDADVRMGAAALLFGQNDRERVDALCQDIQALKDRGVVTDAEAAQYKKMFAEDPAMRSVFVDANREWIAKDSKTPGAYAADVTRSLNDAMNAAIPADCPPEKAFLLRDRKIAAAMEIAEVSPDRKPEAMKALADAVVSTPDLDKIKNDPSKRYLYDEYLKQLTNVVQQILPDSVSTLSPKTVAALQQRVVDAIDVPQTSTEQQAVVQLLKKSKALLSGNSDLAKSLDSKLRDYIDPQFQDAARVSPTMRAAALDALADFGDRDAGDLIAQRISSASEPNAAVRLAAWHSLESVDPERCMLLLKGDQSVKQMEFDPTVVNYLNGIVCRHQDPSPEWKEQNDADYQKAAREFSDAKKNPVVADINPSDVTNWVASSNNLHLILRDQWSADRKTKGDEGWGDCSFYNRYSTEVARVTNKLNGVDTERNVDWNNLCRLAKGQETDIVDASALQPMSAAIQKQLQEYSQKLNALNASLKTQQDDLKNTQTQIAQMKKEDAGKSVDADRLKALTDLQNHEADVTAAIKQTNKSVAAEQELQQGLQPASKPGQIAVAAAVAKRALYDILNGNADGIAGDSDSYALKITFHDQLNLKGTGANSDEWQKKAATALVDAAQPDSVGNDLAILYIGDLLRSKNAVTSGARQILLDGWIKLHDSGARGMDDAKYGAVLTDALRAEAGRFNGDYSVDYEMKLIGAIEKANYFPAVGALEALRDMANVSDAVKKRAGDVAAAMRYAVLPLAQQTTQDKISPAESRAKRTAASLSSFDRSANTEQQAAYVVQDIFNNYAGYTFQSADDPGVSTLVNAMQSKNQRVALAAAIAFMEASANIDRNSNVWRYAAGELAQLAVTGRKDTWRQEATKELSKVVKPGDAIDASSPYLGSKTYHITSDPKGALKVVEMDNGLITGNADNAGHSQRFSWNNGRLRVVVDGTSKWTRETDSAGRMFNTWKSDSGNTFYGDIVLGKDGNIVYQPSVQGQMAG